MIECELQPYNFGAAAAIYSERVFFSDKASEIVSELSREGPTAQKLLQKESQKAKSFKQLNITKYTCFRKSLCVLV